eukprot:835759_1
MVCWYLFRSINSTINQFHLDKNQQNELLYIGASHLAFNNSFYYFYCNESEQHKPLIELQFIVTVIYLLSLSLLHIISESLVPSKTPNQSTIMTQQIKMKSKQDHKQKRNKPNTNTRQSKRRSKELQQKYEKMSKNTKPFKCFCKGNLRPSTHSAQN